MRPPLWAVALATTSALQINASMLDQGLAIIAPLITAELGIAPERVGMLSTASAAGVVLFLVFGAPFIARFGAVRMLQFGALLAAGGAALATSAFWPALLLAAFLIGVGYGPTPPAGSRILAATAPPRHRTLVFSIKQSGAPLGGAIAAMLLAPIAAAYGWRVALMTAIAVSVVAALSIQPLRMRLDPPAHGGAALPLFATRNLAAPFTTLAADPRVFAIARLAFSLALVQSCLFSFSVTYLSTARGLALAEAGMAHAILLVAGASARILLGWLADRTGTPSANLVIQAVIAAVLVAGYGLLPVGTPLALVGAVTFFLGFSAASWNGIFMAEIARMTPPDRIAEATSGGALVAFLGYLIGPVTFSLLVSSFGDYQWPFAIFGAQLLANAALTAALFTRRRLGWRNETS
ncbi:MFS transporter [Acuticoccus sp. M5D2P5]|uniref:MFS transporter n=1 Tax=Acuticoccus kalidii TaxID=2910977 RepID=UPI001F2B1322|nr:MFS transporter [Acuticoccus kalidii]MCF3935699.1 MFS transporter [Acuticoccus kalidii]